MIKNQIGDLTTRRGTKFGLGFELSDATQAALLPGSEEIYRWGGMYFTDYWIDPKEELIALFFTQVWPSKHLFLSKRFQVLTYQAIVD
jgi:CubicO group peptidase (beta-lactamase class C family)